MLKTKRQSQTLIKNPQYFASKLETVYEEAHVIITKDDFGERDLYVAMELFQRYIDILDDITENIHIQPFQPLDIQFKNHTIRFPSEEEFSSWLEL
jgi:hypothetical protein